MNNDLINFVSELEEVARKKFAASTIGAAHFENKLFEEYQKTSSDNSSKKFLKEWLTKRLENEFKCIDRKPIWRGEPEWCYLNGVPMVFITQYMVPVSQKSRRTNLALGDTFYIFGGKIEKDSGREQKYKIVIQDFDGYSVENEIIQTRDMP